MTVNLNKQNLTFYLRQTKYRIISFKNDILIARSREISEEIASSDLASVGDNVIKRHLDLISVEGRILQFPLKPSERQYLFKESEEPQTRLIYAFGSYHRGYPPLDVRPVSDVTENYSLYFTASQFPVRYKNKYGSSRVAVYLDILKHYVVDIGAAVFNRHGKRAYAVVIPSSVAIKHRAIGKHDVFNGAVSFSGDAERPAFIAPAYAVFKSNMLR